MDFTLVKRCERLCLWARSRARLTPVIASGMASGKLNQLSLLNRSAFSTDSLELTQFKVSARDVRGPTEELEH